ncbi:MAG TPA: DUF523 domain-containing protein [Actinomycetota bacterium]|nr:DUF523 domain-containing protein [Actinomycetota bacterium]
MDIPAEGRVLVSACLAGIACTHEAEPKTRAWAVQLVAEGRAVLVCPEVAGGLPIPRPASEIQNGDGYDVIEGRARVLTEHGADVTAQYLKGAEHAATAARETRTELAVLKARSPSCGCGLTYDGTFTGTLRDGDGVTAARLKRDGVTVVSDEEVETA